MEHTLDAQRQSSRHVHRSGAHEAAASHAPRPAHITPHAELQLRQLFDAFCNFGAGHRDTHHSKIDEMDSFKFAKFCRDCGLVDQSAGFGLTEVDLVFTRAKGPGLANRRVGYDAFRHVALPLIAQYKRQDTAMFLEELSQARGPMVAGTVAEANRFHDDHSTYTGVYKAGGPDIHSKTNLDLSEIMDRSDYDVRGRKLGVMEHTLDAQRQSSRRVHRGGSARGGVVHRQTPQRAHQAFGVVSTEPTLSAGSVPPAAPPSATTTASAAAGSGHHRVWGQSQHKSPHSGAQPGQPRANSKGAMERLLAQISGRDK